jgi:hypothetical protein
LITIGCWRTPGAEVTIPNTRSQAATRSGVTQLTLKTSKNGERRVASRRVCGLGCHPTANLAERSSETPIRLVRSVPG